MRNQAALAIAQLLVAAVVLASATVRHESDAASKTIDAMAGCEVAPPSRLDLIAECLAQSPQDVELMLLAVKAHEAAGQHEQAVVLLQRATAVDPIDADARLALSLALGRTGRLEASRREASLAAALRPNDPVAASLASGQRFELR